MMQMTHFFSRFRRLSILSNEELSTHRALPITQSPQPPFPLRLILLGILVVSLFSISFMGWATLVPIESAVVAPGIVNVASHRKQIRHLEGGIIESIHVIDGDNVLKGQLLITLSNIQPAAKLKQLQRQYAEVNASIARLQAERGQHKQIQFADTKFGENTDEVNSDIKQGQLNLFHSRQQLFADKQSVVQNKITQTNEQIKGLQGQIKAKKKQRRYLNEELAIVEKALKNNLLPKTKALKLQQRLSQTDGELSGFKAEIGRLRQGILELKLQNSEASALLQTKIIEQLREKQVLQFELSQKIINSKDILNRTKIISSTDGVVVNLQVHTEQGVIGAGQPLLEILPSNDELIITALINPADIDEVRVGMPADVRLTSFSRRQRIPLQGKVLDVSADRINDEKTKEGFYRARIQLDADVAAEFESILVAGMGAEVFIRTGARTPLEYLLSPISKSLSLGLREQ